MIVLAIDPGFERLGWSVGQILKNGRVNLLAFGLVETKREQTLMQRYEQILQELEGILKQFQPDEAALETLFLFKNQKTVMMVAEVRGMILGLLIRHRVPVAQYSPPQIKAAVAGFGRADKKGVEKMVRLQLQIPPEQKIIDDTFDALAVLLTHAASRKMMVFS